MANDTYTYGTDHAKYSGRLYESDFSTEIPVKNLASRIETDFAFDRYCAKASENRNRYSKKEAK